MATEREPGRIGSIMEKTKIFIADDHRVVIEGIKSALREHPEFEVVGEALDGRTAVKKIRSLRPDIVIMDISMPDLNGIDSTLQIKKIDPTIGVIIYTMYSDREYVTDLFKAGISAYILKEDSLLDLSLAIKAARNGGTYFNAMVQNIILDHLRALEEGKSSPQGALDKLSLREREIFQLLAQGESIKEIAVKLGVSPKTVESHKYNIMDKLRVGSLAELTKIAIKKKYIHP